MVLLWNCLLIVELISCSTALDSVSPVLLYSWFAVNFFFFWSCSVYFLLIKYFF